MIAQAKARLSATRAALAQRAGRRAVAIRASSLSPDGTSAPSPRLARLALTLTLATAGLLALAAAPAFALQTHVFSTSFGTSGSGDGQVSLASNSGVAVNNTSHDVYVADTGNARIDQFSSSGAFIRAFGADVGGPGINVCTTGCLAGTPGSGPGAFTTPTFIAVDNGALSPSAGDVYVGDTGPNTVSKFSSSGAYISTLDGSTATDGPFRVLNGLAVADTGDLFVYGKTSYDTEGVMFQFAEDASFTGDFVTHRGVAPKGIAADSAGGLYFVENPGFGAGLRVYKFDAAGTNLGRITPDGDVSGLAADRSSNDLYVDAAGTAIDHYPPSCSPTGGDQTGCTPADSFGSAHLSAAAGLAVDPSTHTVFAADTGNARVAVFLPAITPDVTTNPATPVGKTSATLNGHLDPAAAGDISDCHFQYTDDATFASQGYAGAATIACDQATPISSPSDVTATPTGLTTGTTYHFRLSATNAQGQNQGADQTFTTNPAVDLTIAPADPVSGTTATVNGHVDSTGGGDITACHFDYTDDASFQANGFSGASSAACTPATPISAPTDVSAALTGLAADTTYHVRLVATNSDGTSATADQPFTTLPIQVIDSATATNLTATEADLNAQINPNGFDTTYHFEWGTADCSANPCTPVPNPEAGIGSGFSDVPVTTHLTGLSANTTYHWRILATSAEGTVGAGVDHTFIFDTSGQGLPDNRAYEQVTPTQKNGALIGDVFILGSAPAIAADGSRVIASSVQCFDGAESCNAVRSQLGSPYAFTRTSAGWQTTALAPPAPSSGGANEMGYAATEGSALFSMPNPASGGADDFYLRRADRSLVDIGPVTPPAGGAKAVNVGAYASVGFSHLVWSVSDPSEHWPFDNSLTGDSLYEYTGVGNSQPPLLVGVSEGPGSTDLISLCGSYGLGMSDDGRTFYFQASKCPQGGSGVNQGNPVPVDELFARVDNTEAGARTVAISQPNALSPAPPNPSCTSAECIANTTDTANFRDAHFAGASADGSKTFFTSTQQLTDTAGQDPNTGDSAAGTEACNHTSGPNGCNLYEFECASCESASERHLIDVSAGDSSGAGPRVRGVVALSADGSHVYFVAQGVLTAAANGQGQSAQNGAANLYVYERDGAHPSGAISFITTLPSADSSQWNRGTGIPANVTPDGRFLVFKSSGRLTPDDTSVSGALQVFRYDAQTGALVRISIGNNGFNDNGNRSTSTPCQQGECSEDARIAPGSQATQLNLNRLDPTMSDDGQYVFFQSPVGLTPGALDDVPTGKEQGGRPVYAANVYEWHGGHVYLISDGRDASYNQGTSAICLPDLTSVCLLGTDATGQNVFFSTANQLLPSDTDTELDYYDARIGGGFPSTPLLPPCQGDACKGAGTQSPAAQAPGSDAFSGPGNPPPHRRHRKKHHHKRHHHKRANSNRGGAR